MKTVITQNTREAYGTMQRRYEKEDPSKIAFNFVKPNSYVLSAGCGAGREIDYLVNNLKCKVVGLDIDKKAIELSKRRTPNAKYILGDMVKMTFKNKFDYITCLWNTINYLDRKSRKTFIETCYKNLNKGGLLILTTTHIFTHWRHLPCNIKYRVHYHPFPWEIGEWFRGTAFEIKRFKIRGGLLIVARK